MKAKKEFVKAAFAAKVVLVFELSFIFLKAAHSRSFAEGRFLWYLAVGASLNGLSDPCLSLLDHQGELALLLFSLGLGLLILHTDRDEIDAGG